MRTALLLLVLILAAVGLPVAGVWFIQSRSKESKILPSVVSQQETQETQRKEPSFAKSTSKLEQFYEKNKPLIERTTHTLVLTGELVSLTPERITLKKDSLTTTVTNERQFQKTLYYARPAGAGEVALEQTAVSEFQPADVVEATVGIDAESTKTFILSVVRLRRPQAP